MFPMMGFDDWMHAERQKLIEGWARLDNATCELQYAVAVFERLKAKSRAISEARLKQIVAADRKCAERARARKRQATTRDVI
jgi:hypothetical protein